MSLIKILPEYLETFTLRLHPNRTFASSSTDGVTTGTLGLVARPSPSIKSVVKIITGADGAGYAGTVFDEGNYYPISILESVNQSFVDNKRDSSWDGTGSYGPNLSAYLSGVNVTTGSHRNVKKFEIKRFDAPFDLGRGNSVKNIVKNVLMPYYRSRYVNCDFTYTNYHSLNFFTSSDVPSGSALIYPNFSGATPGTYKSEDGTIRKESGYGLQQGRPYTPNKGFTFQFYINPRYTTDDPVGTGGASSPTAGSAFHAGTIMHLSSTFAVSLVTGSSVDESGYPDGYRIMLQLSHSAGLRPSQVNLNVDNYARTGRGDLIFLSDDNSLKRNHWHHVAMRWGTRGQNKGSGSFFIDGVKNASFVIPSASIAPPEPVDSFPSGKDPTVISGSDGLVIGNFFEGSNAIGKFFNGSATGSEGCARKVFEDGVNNPYRDAGDENDLCPLGRPQFSHPLNAEIHEIQIWKRALTPEEISSASYGGLGSIDEPWADARKKKISAQNDLAFYLPPFFVKESNLRKVTATPFLFSEGGSGFAAATRDIDITTAQTLGTFGSTATAQTDAPFHVSSSLSVAGHIVSLENFVRDFATGYYPRLFHLTASIIDTTGFTKKSNTYLETTPDGKPWTANRYLYSSVFGIGLGGEIAKRNLTILPNDNGRFQPNFELLSTGSGLGLANEADSIFKTSVGSLDKSIISLVELILTGAKQPPPSPGKSLLTSDADDDSFFRDICGASPPSPDHGTDSPPYKGTINRNYIDYLYVYNKILDPSSNQVTFFNIPNLFYGNRILPESFKITDTSMTGSGGKVKITLKDNGKGGLYRADSTGSHPTWASVGNIFYNEGIVLIKSPNISLFGTGSFETSFQGEQETHILTVNIPCEAGLFTSSSNPSFRKISASFDPNDYDPDFVYITGFNLHDDNLNVIGRATLAQPLIKRADDEFLFKFKKDF